MNRAWNNASDAEGRGMQLPFAGIPSFLRSRVVGPGEDFEAEIAVFRAPTDEGSPYMPGSRFGRGPFDSTR